MPADHTSLVELLAYARHGDAEARNELFRRCRCYVEISAQSEMASWLKAKVDASDLVQQTLLEAHRGFEEFQGSTEGEWLGWLRRILAHNAADFVRRFHGAEKRRVSREVSLSSSDDSQADWDLTDSGETPSQILQQKELQIEIADALSQLSEDHRQVIILRNMQRLPFDEVAENMGRTRPATQMLWMRAIRKLQELLPPRE